MDQIKIKEYLLIGSVIRDMPPHNTVALLAVGGWHARV